MIKAIIGILISATVSAQAAEDTLFYTCTASPLNGKTYVMQIISNTDKGIYKLKTHVVSLAGVVSHPDRAVFHKDVSANGVTASAIMDVESRKAIIVYREAASTRRLGKADIDLDGQTYRVDVECKM